MARSGEDYLKARKRQIDRKKRILTTVSMISFFGSLAFGAISTVQRAIYSPPPVSTTTSAESLLSEQAKGYELVLQREPNNQEALEKLSIIRLRLKDHKGAIALMEKLVQQHPARQDYKTVLEDMNKKYTTK
ncbi:hypothetical protein Nos7524_5196 [Nostoc sp. PCC 7524]|uniref:tetratricopeptide repeat protein n=1 Tax=Nostoc sp. (strain ATCC 29411 / PCC 7524) TaxID=28072 RepID=UPI00029EEB3C|nr:tetratricopeptide repeat protein [Nostoc sp. PCC 7524]AFY50920.1 hypothetical protein Nos7524_5196 [Nostoc sp. PCC 7524]